jgi:anti-anti-sigma factor
MALEFPLEQKQDHVVVRLSGGLTLGPQLKQFARRMALVFASPNPGGVLLDMRGVDQIDSAGLGELVILYTSAGEAGCHLCLVAPTGQVLRLLATTMLSNLFPTFTDDESARTWIRSMPGRV